MTFEEFLEHFHVESQSVDQASAYCPVHGDNRPSLSLGVGRDGRLLLHCFAGCEPDEVLAAVGLSFRDLIPSRRFKLRRKRC